MTDTLFRKNVVLRDWNESRILPLEEGLETLNERTDNNESHMCLMGTKQQINRYLQDAPILSERLRTLHNIPKFRTINTTKVRIQ